MTVFVLCRDVILSVFGHVVTSILRALSLMAIPEENSLLLDFKYNLYFYLKFATTISICYVL